VAASKARSVLLLNDPTDHPVGHRGRSLDIVAGGGVPNELRWCQIASATPHPLATAMRVWRLPAWAAKHFPGGKNGLGGETGVGNVCAYDNATICTGGIDASEN